MNTPLNVLIALDSLRCGGIEKSAVDFIQSIRKDGARVTLLLRDKRGELLPMIPSDTLILEVPFSSEAQRIQKCGWRMYIKQMFLKLRLFGFARALIWLAIIRMLSGSRKQIFEDWLFHKNMPYVQGEYNIAISYAEFRTIRVIAEHSHAKYKYLWLHTALDKRFCNVLAWERLISGMDRIYCVSDDLMSCVRRTFPALKDKVFRYYHIIDGGRLNEAARCYNVEWPLRSPQSVRILSVGRLDDAKGFDLIPEVVLRLKLQGVCVSWKIVGEGYLREKIEKELARTNTSDSIILDGVVENPAPYYKACDIYVQPSRWEGYCLTLGEAMKFAKPIIATDFNGAREQLQDGALGVIVPRENVEALVMAIRTMVVDESLRHKYEALLSPRCFIRDGGIALADMINCK